MILQSKILDYLKYTAKSIQIRFILLLGVSLKMNKPVGSNKQGGTWWNLNWGILTCELFTDPAGLSSSFKRASSKNNHN